MADDPKAPPDLIPPSRFAAALGRARGAKRLEAILSDRDPAARVAELPVQDLYFLIKEIGLEDAQELVELAEPEQFQGLIDLDVWDHDTIKDLDTRPWLAALVAAGPEKLTQVWRELDPEMAPLLLQRWTRIYNLAEEELPDDEEPPFFPTPDRFFMVKITAIDEEHVKLIERLLDSLYRVDMELARHSLRGAMSEPAAHLEEQLYRWRSNRMSELGYADFYEALEVYKPIDLATIQIGEATAERPATPTTLPVPLVDPTMRAGFLGRVLAAVEDPVEAKRIEGVLVTLVNRVLSADRVSPGDLDGAKEGAARAAGTLSVGLETIARGDVVAGTQALRSISLVRLHRAGATVLGRLTSLVTALGKRAARAEEPHASVLAALRQRRPRFPGVLDEPPTVGTRPFASAADVRRAATALAELLAQVIVVFDLLDVDPATRGPAVTLGDVGRTAIVHAALGRGARTFALSADDVWAYLHKTRATNMEEPVLAAFSQLAGERRVAGEYATAIVGWMGDLRARFERLDLTKRPERAYLEGLLLE